MLNFDKRSTYTTVKYSSSNESVAKIGLDGTITPYKVGYTELTAEEPEILQRSIRQDGWSGYMISPVRIPTGLFFCTLC